MKLFISSCTLILLMIITLFYADNSQIQIDYAALDKALRTVECELQHGEIDMQAIESIIASCPSELQKIIHAYGNIGWFDEELPRFILLLGKPGVGKSTLARGIAAKLNLPYQFIQCSLIANEYKNSGTQNIRRIFEEILNNGRQEVIILDELNAITDKHTNSQDQEKDMAMALWQLMDNLKNKKRQALVIATANYGDKMPDPLKDRFSTATFEIPLPDKKTRISIIEHYLNKMKISYDPSISLLIAKKTSYISGRLIEDICKKIVLNAKLRVSKTVRFRGTIYIEKQDIEEAFRAINNSLKASGYTIHSELYHTMKQTLQKIGPYIIPIIGLLFSACSLYIQIINECRLRESLNRTPNGRSLLPESLNKSFSPAWKNAQFLR